jgi:hypothetical protein
MKAATLPSLRVAADLRKAAERVLKDGETLSGLITKQAGHQTRAGLSPKPAHSSEAVTPAENLHLKANASIDLQERKRPTNRLSGCIAVGLVKPLSHSLGN